MSEKVERLKQEFLDSFEEWLENEEMFPHDPVEAFGRYIEVRGVTTDPPYHSDPRNKFLKAFKEYCIKFYVPKKLGNLYEEYVISIWGKIPDEF